MRDNDQYWDWLDRAMDAAHRGRTDEALVYLDKALQTHPAGAEAHNGRGEILWDEGKIHEALHELAAAQEAATPEELMQCMRGHVDAETSNYFMRAALGA